LLTLTGETKEDIGKTVVYEGADEVAIGGDIAIAIHSQNGRFMSYLLNSPFVVQQKSSLSTGDQIIHIGVSKLGSIILPIPPINEQNRIVKMIEKLNRIANQLSC
jgi:type I restriction enzyme S subunit